MIASAVIVPEAFKDPGIVTFLRAIISRGVLLDEHGYTLLRQAAEVAIESGPQKAIILLAEIQNNRKRFIHTTKHRSNKANTVDFSSLAAALADELMADAVVVADGTQLPPAEPPSCWQVVDVKRYPDSGLADKLASWNDETRKLSNLPVTDRDNRVGRCFRYTHCLRIYDPWILGSSEKGNKERRKHLQKFIKGIQYFVKRWQSLSICQPNTLEIYTAKQRYWASKDLVSWIRTADGIIKASLPRGLDTHLIVKRLPKNHSKTREFHDRWIEAKRRYFLVPAGIDFIQADGKWSSCAYQLSNQGMEAVTIIRHLPTIEW
ncbi:hypothetical protein N9971_00190 [bacterium]|nr:hypothetical protein [bacterium]